MGLRSEELRRIRWRKLALIPQGAMNSLNPVLRVGRQLEDVIRTHEKGLFRQNLKERILGLFRSVGLPDRVYGLYPHELSGGMKQRVCIAMAIALGPPLIIADEPTSALDVVVQRTVAQTLLGIKEKMGVTLLVIGHDMGLMAQLADRLVVMYAGHVVEIAGIEAIYDKPLHPYTQLLIESVPSVRSRKPLKVTEGLTHDLRHLPKGCVFQYRCEKVHDACRSTSPERMEVEPGHEVACWLYGKDG
jgi:oligopeptide/dipeptide ABC transporter ATP-binding protein